jgi:nitroimidazol reductase NimA-like FMN-containing flavoprotein (pyridoxamine 5'-phosphate oxidase superfamily)
MSAVPENYEDVTVYGLDDDVENEMLLTQNECTFIWSNKDGWPVGVIMSYVFRDGKFWLTATSQRARMKAIARDPRVCVVVTSTGTKMARNKTVTYKGTCQLHDSREIKEWFYPELAKAVMGDNVERRAVFEKLLDSPRRLIIEVEPTQRIGYDGTKMGTATTALMDRLKESDVTA